MWCYRRDAILMRFIQHPHSPFYSPPHLQKNILGLHCSNLSVFGWVNGPNSHCSQYPCWFFHCNVVVSSQVNFLLMSLEVWLPSANMMLTEVTPAVLKSSCVFGLASSDAYCYQEKDIPQDALLILEEG